MWDYVRLILECLVDKCLLFFVTEHLFCIVIIIKTERKTRNVFLLIISEATKQSPKFKGYRNKTQHPVTSASEILVNYKIIYQEHN